MSSTAPDWSSRRFFLPNEDAGAVRAALARCPQAPTRPVFVGGSGMVLLDAASDLHGARATFVDVSEAQVTYFGEVVEAVRRARDAGALRAWFLESVYPRLAAHQAARGAAYPADQVLDALRSLFRIRFFFDDDALALARTAASAATAVCCDVVAYLAGCGRQHDFVYLSNVPDYLTRPRLRALFAACRRHRAPVYLLLTSACADPAAVERLWVEEGFVDRSAAGLDAENRGLGAPGLERPWNRPGHVHLLELDPAAAARADEQAQLRYLHPEAP